ncbi:MAG: hypothetical protein RBU45_26695 [Myxococcota bacterium]|jgi:hypothetical protein|nr:hypothetical protein [Myxococcota bacterium]
MSNRPTLDEQRRNLVAQWVFDTRAILDRFHLWLTDVEEVRTGVQAHESLSFMGQGLEKAGIMTAAVTALGTRLFGRFGEGRGLDKHGLNRVKKDADAASAYSMSEALWHLSRYLPENHALLVSIGEGLMPKVGETPEMGSNPQLGFGRVYARPGVARYLDDRVGRLLNDPAYGWEQFWKEVQEAGITIWGAAIDTLENTTRFAKGSPTGPMTILHLFDQPLAIAQPYEGYMGNLVLPREVVEQAAERSVLLSYLTPRSLVMKSLLATYPELKPERVHVWTLGGSSRRPRIGELWQQWEATGAHLIEDGWTWPTGLPSFHESGTYAPTFSVGPYRDAAGALHLILGDGYAASAEALQAASLDPALRLHTSLCLFSSHFDIPWDRESQIMRLDATAPDFAATLSDLLGHPASPTEVQDYQGILANARAANMPLARRTVTIDDFFPNKQWRVLALAGFMLPDPYTGHPGVEELEPGAYRVTTRAVTERGTLDVKLTLRLREDLPQSHQVFSPLLDRFYHGLDHTRRAVKISDSGRIRNELQTLCSEALEFTAPGRVKVHFDQVDDAVLAPDKRARIREVLRWYKAHHPIWFSWLDVD